MAAADRRRRHPQGRVEGDRRDGARPDRRGRRRRRPPHQLLDPPGRPRARRGSTRSRSSTAGSCSRRRRSTAPTARTPSPRTSAAPACCCSPRRRCSSGSSPTSSLDIYECGRNDIATGQIDRRVLAMLEYLARKGFEPDDHLAQVRPQLPHHARGNVSEHTTGDAVDIAGDQRRPGDRPPGPGHDHRRADPRRCSSLQGTMQPHQVISLEDLPGETSFALPDHYDHVHIGYHPTERPVRPGQFIVAAQTGPVDPPDRAASDQIENPEVPTEPSQLSVPDGKQGPASGRRHGRPGEVRRHRKRRLTRFGQQSVSSDPALRIRAVRLRRHPGRWPTAATWCATARTARSRACWSSRPSAAPPLPSRRRRRPAAGRAGRRPARQLPLSRATAVRAAEPFERAEEAERWLDAVGRVRGGRRRPGRRGDRAAQPRPLRPGARRPPTPTSAN